MRCLLSSNILFDPSIVEARLPMKSAKVAAIKPSISNAMITPMTIDSGKLSRNIPTIKIFESQLGCESLSLFFRLF
jgi:hypothetical protein